MDKPKREVNVRTASIALIVVLTIVLSPMVNQECTKYLDNWTKKSVVTFAVATGINSGLSVIEDSELQAGIGVSASIAVGDAVRPLNDMVGRVASIALASAVSLGIQRVLIGIGASVAFKWFLAISFAGLLVAEWVNLDVLRKLASWSLVLALAATLAIPGAVFITGRVGDQFTKNAYSKAQVQMQGLKTEVTRIDPKNLSHVGDRLKSTAAAYGELTVNYIVVFIVQTMLMPLLVLWALVRLLGRVVSPTPGGGMEARLLAAIRGNQKSTFSRSPQTTEAATEVQV